MLYKTLRAGLLVVGGSSQKEVCGYGHQTLILPHLLRLAYPASVAHDGMGLGGYRLEGELSWGPHLCPSVYRKVVHTGVRLNLGVAVLGPPMCFISKSWLDFEGIVLALPYVLCNKGGTQDRIPRILCGSLKFLAVKRGCDW